MLESLKWRITQVRPSLGIVYSSLLWSNCSLRSAFAQGFFYSKLDLSWLWLIFELFGLSPTYCCQIITFASIASWKPSKFLDYFAWHTFCEKCCWWKIGVVTWQMKKTLIHHILPYIFFTVQHTTYICLLCRYNAPRLIIDNKPVVLQTTTIWISRILHLCWTCALENTSHI